jgi:Fe-S-cluster containining protein
MKFPVEHPLLNAPEGALDRFVELLAEDQALRAEQYEKPDPKRRRLRVACNDCDKPWCCNQRVRVDLVEVLAIYRYAAEHAPRELGEAIARGHELRARSELTESEFFRRRAPCPFLTRGRCTVYAVRPHQCRCHYMAGNPLKCRDELTPSETYAMDPDRALLGELEEVAESIRFEHLAEGMRPSELAEALALVDALVRRGPWKAPRVVDWDLVE